MFLLIHLSFVANSSLNAMFTFTLQHFSTAFLTHSSSTLPASSKKTAAVVWYSPRFWPHRSERNSRTQCRSLVKQESFIATRVFAYCHQRVRKVACDFAPAILVTADCLSLTTRRGRTAKFFELLDALIASLQPRETLHQSSDLAALLQQFTFYLARDFPCFFTIFRSHSYMQHLHVTHSHALQHHFI